MSRRSWRSVVRKADPDFDREAQRPIAYEFGGRKVEKREKTNESGPYAPRD